MNLRKVCFDTNVYVDWFNRSEHEELMVGGGFVRYLCAIVQMELRVGAKTLPARRALDQLVRGYRAAGRIIVPSVDVYDDAGRALQRLREKGIEIRRASMVHDLLIALSARSLGATVLTMDADFGKIASIVDVRVQIVGR
jgi:predicted nucleic acid-binding protein